MLAGRVTPRSGVRQGIAGHLRDAPGSMAIRRSPTGCVPRAILGRSLVLWKTDLRASLDVGGHNASSASNTIYCTPTPFGTQNSQDACKVLLRSLNSQSTCIPLDGDASKLKESQGQSIGTSPPLPCPGRV